MAAVALIAVIVAGSFAYAAKTGASVVIKQNGHVKVMNARVTGISGNTFSASATWGSLIMNWTVNTNDNSNFILNQGSKGSLAQIEVGHMVAFEGTLDGTASTPTVIARMVRDYSVRKVHINSWGVITSLDTAGKKFVATFSEKDKGELTINVADSTKIMKGTRAISISDLNIGDQVQVVGVWDKETKTVNAEKIEVRVQVRHIFEGGKLKTLPGSTTPPASMGVTFGKIDYTITIAVDTAILKNDWTKASLSDFKMGNHIRVSGVADGSTIHATTVRNVSIKK